jgi:tetratricopeptide (TPR) repeat protein
MRRPAGFVTMLSRALRPSGIFALLAAALTIGGIKGAAAASEIDTLMAGRGKDVYFAVSCDPKLQPRFDAALAALHSFWYGQALKEFTAISEADPQCAMSDWGIAMSLWNQLWAPPRPDSLKKGLAAIEKAGSITQKSQRESDYIEALATFYSGADKLDHPTRAKAYAAKMQQLSERYPDDREAQIFYALSLLASADPLDKTYANQLKAGGMLEKLFAEMPEHPAISHYIIHAYDYPALADRALDAALKYAVCVTIVPHAVHMPSHTYVLLGRWQDTIKANIAGQEAESERGTPEDRIHDLDYLVYAYLQLGQDTKAKQVVDLAVQIDNELVARNHDAGLRARPFGVAAMEARWTLERHDWAAAAAVPVRASRYPYAEAVTRFARAVGLARSGRPNEAQAEVDALAALQKTLTDAKNLYWARQVGIERTMASAWVARALGRDEEAVALMQDAARTEESSETHDTLSPGPIGMTAHEALGYLLLELKRPAEASKAFEASLQASRNRLQSYAGAANAAALAGNSEDARKYYRKLLELTADSDGVRPEILQAKAYVKAGDR